MSLTTIVEDMTGQVGITNPTFLVGSSDTSARQLLRFAQLAGDTLLQDHAWGQLIRRNTFSQSATFDDFDRFYPVSSIWDVNRSRPLAGPLNQEEWNNLLVRNITGGEKYWTMYQGSIWIYPAPEATDEFTFSYVTSNWIRPVDGADVPRWSADTDESLIPDQLIVLSMVWRWKQSKSLDYAEDLSTFERTRERLMARDRGPRLISTTRAFHDEEAIDNIFPGAIVP
jgi:hypothetical protein